MTIVREKQEILGLKFSQGFTEQKNRRVSPNYRRPVFVIRLRPEPRVDPIRALRGGLKALKRQFGLKCVDVREHDDFGRGSSEPGVREIQNARPAREMDSRRESRRR